MKCSHTLAGVSFLAILGAAALPSPSHAKPAAPPPPACTSLGAKLLGGDIKYANSQLVLAGNKPAAQAANFTGTTPGNANSTATVSYCFVVLQYSTTKPTDPTPQNVTIYVALPLNTTDGGVTGSTTFTPLWNFPSIQGNWNGRTEGTGGGGCSGNTNATGPVINGIVGSATDGGHGSGNVDYGDNSCSQAVPSLGHLNKQFVTDWVYTGPVQSILQSEAIAKLYYGMAPKYNYWNGCSTGGHQGYAIAQTIPTHISGLLASAPAMYWTRFQTAQMWGQVAMYDIAQEVIASAKLTAVQQAAIAACDGNDGVLDGIIDDPRTCTFNASANICGAPTAPATNCLTTAEADAVNIIWDGPRNGAGNRIWFPLDRGTSFGGWDGNVPFALAPTQFGWDTENPAYYAAGNFTIAGDYPGFWGNVALNPATQATQGNTVTYTTNYSVVAQDGSRNVADLSDTFDDVDGLKAAGGKMITFVGGNDQLIMPRGVINYYRQMAQRYKKGNDPTGFAGVQRFYRLFHVPGAGHCGGGGPWPAGGVDFDAVINWVENGVAPSEVIGSGTTGGAFTRPDCPYPQTAVYIGSGAISSAANWVCGGNLEKNVPIQVGTSPPTPIAGAKPVPCYDVLVKYKSEVSGPLDYAGSGVNQASCQ